jgi:hypothetical protein
LSDYSLTNFFHDCTCCSWVCVIFFARRGVQGGSAPKKKKIYLEKHVTYLGGFPTHGFFVDGFLFPVKELGLLINPSHWVAVLDVVGSYMYILL